MAESKLIALIGCGLWGEKILRELQRFPVEIHIVDSDPERQRYALENGAVGGVSTICELPDVSGFIIATPASTHKEIVEQVAPKGKPVFCEKPFVLNLEEAESLGMISELRLSVMHVWRYHPGVQELKRIIQNADIGLIECIRTRRCNWTSPRTDCDPIWTLLPHDISILTELFGTVPRPKYAIADRGSWGPTGLTAILDGMCPCVVEVSTRYAEKVREVRLHGSKGVAVLSGDKAEVEIFRGDSRSKRFERNTVNVSSRTALSLELEAFIESLDGGGPPKTTLDEAISITRCIVAIRNLAGISDCNG